MLHDATALGNVDDRGRYDDESTQFYDELTSTEFGVLGEFDEH
jgi:hypothetical protein